MSWQYCLIYIVANLGHVVSIVCAAWIVVATDNPYWCIPFLVLAVLTNVTGQPKDEKENTK